jgi:hypothetical protein
MLVKILYTQEVIVMGLQFEGSEVSPFLYRNIVRERFHVVGLVREQCKI